MRCPRCGNENPDQNRFCGMCGASLLAPPAAKPGAPQPVAVAASDAGQAVSAAPRAAEQPRPALPEPPPATPSISVPSFLGLSDPPPSQPAPRQRASLSIDPNSAPGSNLDYLLDEEEPRGGWGIGKILLILIALGLAVGFGYLRFKNQGLAWLNLLPKKPAAVAQNSTDTPAPAPSSTSITPDSQAPASQPAPGTSQDPAASPGSAAPTNSGNATPVPAASAPASTPPAADTTKPTDSASPAPSDKATAPADKDSTTEKEASPDAAAPATTPVESPKPAPKPPAPKLPTPKPSAAKATPAFDPVAQAERYLYGRGANQDCDRGMRLLKPEANKGNPKAMIEMGALYSAGLCTPHDLPTAYRWFAMALRKDPENTAVQADLQKLWGEMTQPERQLAIKLTQ